MELHNIEEQSEDCKLLILQLAYAVSMVGGGTGRSSISRQVVRQVFFYFGQVDLPSMAEAQQRGLRSRHWKKLAADNTFYSAASLGGADYFALTSSGRPKNMPFNASVTTVATTNGLILVSALVPNDGQEHLIVILEALFCADPREGGLNHLLNAVVRLGGALGGLPEVITTDFSSRDFNLWRRAAPRIIQACIQHDIPVMIPEGVPILTSRQCCVHCSYGALCRRG